MIFLNKMSRFGNT